MYLFNGFDGQIREDVLGFRLECENDCSAPAGPSCKSRCHQMQTCTACLAMDSCIWCEAEQLCTEKSFTVNCMGGLSATCDLAASSKNGLIRELYYSDGWAAFPDSLSTSDLALQLNAPDENEQLRGSFTFRKSFSAQTLQRIHGYIVPLLAGEVRFWVRASQGLPVEVYFNRNGDNSSSAPLLFKVPSTTARPVTFTAGPPVSVVDGQRYYIAVLLAGDANLELQFDVAMTSGDAVEASEQDIIPASMLQPYKADNCSSLTYCQGCTATDNCVWCGHKCVDGSDTLALLLSCNLLQTTDSKHCTKCTSMPTCEACLAESQENCEWRGTQCVYPHEPQGLIHVEPTTELYKCPLSCDSRTNCSDCLEDGFCKWCADPPGCVQTNTLDARYPMGECRNVVWFEELCVNCEELTTCTECLEVHGCGWSSQNNPDGTKASGACVPGTYAGPQNPPLVDPADSRTVWWAYARCDGACDTDHLREDGFCVLHCPGCKGQCTAPGTCECSLGWNGPNCTYCEYISLPPGPPGTPELPEPEHSCGPLMVCIPPGVDRNEDFVYSDWLAAQGGSVPEGVFLSCACRRGYYLDTDGTCVTCESHGCIHGTCSAAGQCECDAGFGGVNCTECRRDENYLWCVGGWVKESNGEVTA